MKDKYIEAFEENKGIPYPEALKKMTRHEDEDIANLAQDLLNDYAGI